MLALFSAISGSGSSDDAAALHWIDDPRKIIATILFICSRGWLLLFLAWRAHERGGDSRFDDVLGKGGGSMQPLTFFVFWMAQAFWVYLISWPLLFINSSNVKRAEFSVYDITFAILFGCGVLIEILADIQKALWVRNGRQGDFCSGGVWKFSRHPNYFGEIFQWWCLWAFAYSSSQNPNGGYADPLWWAGIGEFIVLLLMRVGLFISLVIIQCYSLGSFSLVSPLFTMHILLNMKPTGLCNAEAKNLKRYYDKCPARYAAYRANTSILIPMMGYQYLPMFLKRTIFFDFEKYEYTSEEELEAKRE